MLIKDMSGLVNMAAADIDGDGIPEIAVGTGFRIGRDRNRVSLDNNRNCSSPSIGQSQKETNEKYTPLLRRNDAGTVAAAFSPGGSTAKYQIDFSEHTQQHVVIGPKAWFVAVGPAIEDAAELPV